MKNRSWRFLCALPLTICILFTILAGCGKTFYFANRALPPSGIANPASVAVQIHRCEQRGSVDSGCVLRHPPYSYNNTTPSFAVSGFSGTKPLTIQNMPAAVPGALYSEGDGSYAIVYVRENQTSAVTGRPDSPQASLFRPTSDMSLPRIPPRCGDRDRPHFGRLTMKPACRTLPGSPSIPARRSLSSLYKIAILSDSILRLVNNQAPANARLRAAATSLSTV